MEVCPLSCEVMLPCGATSIRSITERHSLSPSSFTRYPIGFSYESLSLAGECRAYHVSREYLNGLGAAFSPVVLISTSKDIVTFELDHLPFWFKPVSIFGLSALTTFIGSSLSFTLPFPPSS